MAAFKTYIGYDFGRPNILSGQLESYTDNLPPTGGIRDWGFGWRGADENNNAVINEGIIVTFGGYINVPQTNIACTGTFDNPGVIFCEIKRVTGSGFSAGIICTTLSSFAGHTNDAWRFPLYLVYVGEDGFPKYKSILGIGLICI